jgi:hypothetical protein
MSNIVERVESDPLLQDAVREVEVVEREAGWLYRDFTGTSPESQ